MPHVYGHTLKPAGDHVLSLLKAERRLRYNERFYGDGDDALDRELRVKFGMDPADPDSPAIRVDIAVAFLAKAGLVDIQELPETMGDGEPDYEIVLTASDAAFLESGQEFRYRDLYL